MWIEALLGTTLLAAAVVSLAPDRYAARLSFALSLVPLAISLAMFRAFEGVGNVFLGAEPAFQTKVAWFRLPGVFDLQWHVGVDGISMPLVALSTVLTTAAIVSAWTPIDDRQSQFYGLVLFMEAALLGVFTALDFFLWFVFWEFVLVPMYFLIGVWGGPRRKYAAIKFFVYTNIASLVMFIGFMALVFGAGLESLDLPTVATAINPTVGGGSAVGGLGGISGETLTLLAFLAMFVGFGVKVPIVPFHTWLPDAHVEAPTPASVVLAGALLKMGTYALLRFNFTMLPETAAALAVPIAAIAVLSVLYGAMLALAQRDMKRIVAYSSISSMGYVLLGLVAYTEYGLGGATFQMISHGLISGLMFMCVGVIYNVAHTRMVGDLSGIADRMPVTAGVFVAAAFAYMGLPLMSGFAAEFFVFVGSFGAPFRAAPLFTAAAMFGIVVVAGYLLYMMQRSLFGPFRADTDYEIVPAARHDVLPLVALVLLVVLLGVVPDLAFDMIQDAVIPLTETGEQLQAAPLLGGDR